MAAGRQSGGEPARQHASSPVFQEVVQIKRQIDALASRIQQGSSWSPAQKDLDALADQIIRLCNLYHDTITPWDKHLKAAIIDLTEVPTIMAPELQPFAFKTSLKEASKSLSQFLEGNW